MSDQTPANFDLLYPGRFIKAASLKGIKRTFTIEDVLQEELEGDKGIELKVIMKLRHPNGKLVELVLAKLNAICICEMFGKSVPSWIGKRITLFPTAEFAPMKRGEECIRVWGSPDVPADQQVTIKLPKRKAFDMIMHAVQAAPATP